jgi:hypothetical protein
VNNHRIVLRVNSQGGDVKQDAITLGWFWPNDLNLDVRVTRKPAAKLVVISG